MRPLNWLMDRPTAAEPPAPAPLIVWVLAQLATICLCAAQVPLADHYPRPVERLAAQSLVVVQVILSGMLLPWLLRGGMQASMAILASVPMVQLAGYLSALPDLRTGLLAIYVAAWLIGLGLLNAAIPGMRGRMILCGVVCLWSLGGLVGWYLRAEFAGSGGNLAWDRDAYWGPAMGGIAVAASDPTLAPWVAVVGVLIGGLAGWRLAARTRRTRPIPTSS